MFQYVSFSFYPFGTIHEINRLDGILKFLDYFLVKKMRPLFFKNNFRFDWWLQILHNDGVDHRNLKRANILVSNERYADITEAAELNVWP